MMTNDSIVHLSQAAVITLSEYFTRCICVISLYYIYHAYIRQYRGQYLKFEFEYSLIFLSFIRFSVLCGDIFANFRFILINVFANYMLCFTI